MQVNISNLETNMCSNTFNQEFIEKQAERQFGNLAGDASRRVHRPRLYHGQRLGKLSEGRHGLRHPAAGGSEGVRQAARADLYTVHQGGNRRSRREHFL